MAQPGEGPFNNPAVPVAAQLAPILMGGLSVVAPGRNDRLNPTPDQRGPQLVADVAPIAIRRSGRLRGRPALPVRPTATVSSVFSSSVTSAGQAESRYAPSGVPAPSTKTIHLVP